MSYNKYIFEFIENLENNNLKLNKDYEIIFKTKISQLSINYKDHYESNLKQLNKLIKEYYLLNNFNDYFESKKNYRNYLIESISNLLNDFIIRSCEYDFYDYVKISYKLKNNKTIYLCLLSAYTNNEYIQKELIKMGVV